jgi:hypothetical protein
MWTAAHWRRGQGQHLRIRLSPPPDQYITVQQLAYDAQFPGYASCLSDEVQLAMSLPLDNDGFLRRECPTCEREFKWLRSPDPEADEDAIAETAGSAEAPESYCYPYCAVTAPPDAWLTKAQVAAMEEIVQRELIDPELDKLVREVDRLNRSSGGLIGIEVRVEREEPEPVPELDEDVRSPPHEVVHGHDRVGPRKGGGTRSGRCRSTPTVGDVVESRSAPA